MGLFHHSQDVYLKEEKESKGRLDESFDHICAVNEIFTDKIAVIQLLVGWAFGSFYHSPKNRTELFSNILLS